MMGVQDCADLVRVVRNDRGLLSVARADVADELLGGEKTGGATEHAMGHVHVAQVGHGFAEECTQPR
ncbi:hypothetical protein AB0M39_20650 [Streptomyces sp. NPDC051907]|uniref:hypothetical protein n=1 Tax=Streptomyces sp. NPDC051907 TaxID=3155284 RepID=UPI0034424E37